MQDVSAKITCGGTQSPGDQVKQIRDLLRQAEVKRKSSDEAAAIALADQAERLIGKFITGLTRRIENVSRRAFGSLKRAQMAEDLFGQIVRELLVSIRRDSESSSFLETNFNAAFRNKCKDAVRRVLSENGIKRGQKNEGGEYTVISADEPLQAGQDSEESLSVVDTIADTQADAAFADCTMGIALEQALHKVDKLHKLVFMLRFYRKWSWNRIAQQCGLSEKTARNYSRAVRMALLQDIAPEMLGELADE